MAKNKVAGKDRPMTVKEDIDFAKRPDLPVGWEQRNGVNQPIKKVKKDK